MAKLFAILSLLLLFSVHSLSFSPEDPSNRKILVLLDDFALKSSHSLYFKSLQSRGYDLDFKLADDPKIALQRYGQFLYDGLVVFAPTTERFGGSVNQAAVLEFVDSGRDLIIAADVNSSDLIREIATEMGVEFDEDPAAMVIDHTSYAVSSTEGGHTLLAADDFIQSDVILGGKKIEAPVLYRGIAHSVNPTNSLVLKVLASSPAAYSANPKSKLSNAPVFTGSSISLVSVLQARNNARVLITGSLSIFSDRFFRSEVQKAGSSTRYEKSGNEQFVTELNKWIFHERGHLKGDDSAITGQIPSRSFSARNGFTYMTFEEAVNVRHHKVEETNEPSIYRITDDLEYSVEIYEWSGKSWEPYVSDDVQVQFYMMSPYVLKTLSTDKKGRYYTSFKVPDVYGVFQFKVEYQRLGYTSLSLSKQIPVRPFRHNEYERFITTAYPYYGSCFSMMAGFFVFILVHLYNK